FPKALFVFMALRLGKRKMPRREDKQLKEALKRTNKVLDDLSLSLLASLINAKAFKSLDYPIAQGKEAVVFRATKHDGSFVAVKVFKFETTAFRNVIPYIEGDPRFNIDAVKHSKRGLVKVWTRKEFANLSACFQAGARVPQPFALKENIIVMGFIGVNGVPCALLNEVVLQNPKEIFRKIVESVRTMFKAGIVHSDLSPFNVMLLQTKNADGSYEETPFIIDLAQGVSIKHPKAQEFLERDARNLCAFFAKAGVKKKPEDVVAFVKGGKKSV
ncbi:MAG: RIO1 family regulatory kinase/ATPase, partial [Candidatus Micrarchaeota archaeon]